MKKLDWKISGFDKFIPSRNKLNIRSKFMYKWLVIKYERNSKFNTTNNNNPLPLIVFLL